MNLSALKSRLPKLCRRPASRAQRFLGAARHHRLARLGDDRIGGFVGLVAFLNFFPTLFVSPLFGVFADRIDVRKGSILSYALAGILSALFAGLCIFGSPTPVLLALFSFVTGVISSANHRCACR